MFTRKHLHWSLFFNKESLLNFVKKEHLVEHLRTAVSAKKLHQFNLKFFNLKSWISDSEFSGFF